MDLFSSASAADFLDHGRASLPDRLDDLVLGQDRVPQFLIQGVVFGWRW